MDLTDGSAMFEVLYAYFERNIKLSDDDIVLIESLFLPKVLEKGQHIVKQGEVPRYASYLGITSETVSRIRRKAMSKNSDRNCFLI
jgi:hypothetical protein